MLIFVVLTYLATWVHCARILAVLPTPSYSHQSVFKVYIETLAKRGHEIVLLQPTTRISYQFTKNITIVDASMSQSYFDRLVGESAVFRKRGLIADSSTVTAQNYMGLVKMIHDQFELPSVKKFLETRRYTSFDLLITEAFLDYPLVISHLFENVPVVQISSGYGVAENFEVMGATSRHPLYYPNMWRDRFANLNMWDTVAEIYMEIKLQKEFSVLADEQSKLMKKQFGPQTPDVQKLRDNVQLLFVNTHPVFDNNRPVPPSVQYLGGLHLHDKSVKPLSQYVQKFLDASVQGVVYVSFGSSVNARDMDREFLEMMIETFQRLPYRVAWKFDTVPDLIALPENVIIQAWYDQYSLLHHPNVKAFVTQGGVQSTDEAIEALVPLVGVPMMGDQFFNTNKYAELEIGCAVHTATVNSEQLFSAIIDAATNTKYKSGLHHLRKLIHHQPMTPLNKAIWYTEHVINSSRHHGKTAMLKTKAANVNYSNYFMSHILLPLVSLTVLNHLQQLMRMTFFSM
ncbi:egt [Sucra jujuba nucleopolyhedrovirus]|uniref:Ecdysteroid UDP-glucosyltransferase n=1 Tax=Sucra jujuba nucleopolyhedrovirus TaxID=1563660 RepID=A0A097P964_9ABAC|nr:egt [Sucra jujuba nucleopolyhedrovirus]AIU41358.1 egt [Sucra jujuba nucleopolyhedrovirus]